MPRSFSILGDSISTFKGLIPEENRWYYDSDDTNSTGITSPDETWWMQTIRSMDGSLLSNASFSGSMVQGFGFPAACDPKRARQLLGAEGQKPDCVLVFVGINDYGWGSPKAQAAGGSEAASAIAEDIELEGIDPAGPAPRDAARQFGEAYEQMLANIREAVPDAEIWCVTIPPGRVSGNPRSTFCCRLRSIDIADYNRAIVDAANATGAQVADAYSLGYDYDATDGTHPTRDGMAQLAKLVCAAVLKSQGDARASADILEDYPGRLRSQRFCDKPSCIDCEFSPIEPNRWSCVCAQQLDR